MRRRQPRLAAARRAFLTASGNPFFKGVLRREVALRVERPRHQLTPTMPPEKLVDRAVAGLMADCLLIGELEVVNVQQFAGARGVGKARQ